MTLLVAYGSQAQADYIALSEASETEASASMSLPSQPDADLPDVKLLGQLPFNPAAWGQTPQSSGFGGTSSARDSGGAGQQAGCPTPQLVPRLELIGRIFLSDLSNRPPPFPSRLFRPPRA